MHMGITVSLYIFSLKIHSPKDMMCPEALVSLLANKTTRFTKLHICLANTALPSFIPLTYVLHPWA